MSEPKFTPGPWKVGPVDDTRVEDALGNEVAQIDGDYNHPDTWPIMEANARLIASAPELYEALEGLIDIADRGDVRDYARDAINTAKRALTKARGE